MYVGVLTTALGAMAVDVLFLRAEPRSASATDSIALAPPPDATNGSDAKLDPAEPTLAEVIASLGPKATPPSDSLFALPKAWLPSEDDSSTSDNRLELPVLVLTNTLADVAQINDRAIRAGAFVDRERTVRLVRIENVGMRINEVGQSPSAIIEFSGVLYRLRAGSDGPERLIAPDSADSAGDS